MEKIRLESGRSRCPVAGSLDVMGDRWTLLVVRDLAMGASRFKDFAASPEGIPTNILSERLSRLLAYGIVEQVEVSPGAKRKAYALTERGRELVVVMRALKDWGLRHLEGAAVPPVEEQGEMVAR